MARKKKRLSLEERKKLAKAPPKVTRPDNFNKVQQMAQAYERALGLYAGKPGLKYLKGMVLPNQTAYHIWARTVLIAEELGASYDRYLRAIFYFSDKWFHKAPRPQDCCNIHSKISAPMRFLLYVDTVEGTGIDPGQLVRPLPMEKIEPEVIKSHNDKTMSAFCKNFDMSPVQVFTKLKDNLDLFFDNTWLENNEIYQKLIQEN